MKDGATEEEEVAKVRKQVVTAALPNVVFDGWSDRTLADAVIESGVDPAISRLAFPRGGIDLVLAFHYDRDDALFEHLSHAEMGGMRFRDKIAYAVMQRLMLVAPEREAVRRAASMLALPNYAPDAARAIWHTADTIWNALGDTSSDYNWYTKRTTLSAVYSSSALYWLGDETSDFSSTREFVNRRIDNVMQFEEVKAKLKANPVASRLMEAPRRVLDRVRAPVDSAPNDLPGSVKSDT
ncbi:MAG: COQ9 family protein [Pseudomonadota bacterium]